MILGLQLINFIVTLYLTWFSEKSKLKDVYSIMTHYTISFKMDSQQLFDFLVMRDLIEKFKIIKEIKNLYKYDFVPQIKKTNLKIIYSQKDKKTKDTMNDIMSEYEKIIFNKDNSFYSNIRVKMIKKEFLNNVTKVQKTNTF